MVVYIWQKAFEPTWIMPPCLKEIILELVGIFSIILIESICRNVGSTIKESKSPYHRAGEGNHGYKQEGTCGQIGRRNIIWKRNDNGK